MRGRTFLLCCWRSGDPFPVAPSPPQGGLRRTSSRLTRVSVACCPRACLSTTCSAVAELPVYLLTLQVHLLQIELKETNSYVVALHCANSSSAMSCLLAWLLFSHSRCDVLGGSHRATHRLHSIVLIIVYFQKITVCPCCSVY